MAKTLKNLALALINATLMLIALCLFLAWQLAIKADDITENIAGSLTVITPVKDRLEATQAELAGLRADLAAVKAETGDEAGEAMGELKTRIDALYAKLGEVEAAIAGIKTSPEAMIDQAVTSTAVQVRQGIADFRGCTPAT
ncbi:MAG: hypothetical protein KDK29_03045 [Sedimentitalea sp.]|nr:hypothetical protein [Sedimentitalea sp.]